MHSVSRSVFRSLMGIALAALATWLANYLTDKIFGPEELEAGGEQGAGGRG
jgi:hypothetical protein